MLLVMLVMLSLRIILVIQTMKIVDQAAVCHSIWGTTPSEKLDCVSGSPSQKFDQISAYEVSCAVVTVKTVNNDESIGCMFQHVVDNLCKLLKGFSGWDAFWFDWKTIHIDTKVFKIGWIVISVTRCGKVDDSENANSIVTTSVDNCTRIVSFGRRHW